MRDPFAPWPRAQSECGVALRLKDVGLATLGLVDAVLRSLFGHLRERWRVDGAWWDLGISHQPCMTQLAKQVSSMHPALSPSLFCTLAKLPVVEPRA